MTRGEGLTALFLLFLTVVGLFCWHNITRKYTPERECKDHNRISVDDKH